MESTASPIQPLQPHPPKRAFRPVVLLLTLLARVAPDWQPFIQKSVIRAWYQFLNAPGRGAEITTMNYGYAPRNDQPANLDKAFEQAIATTTGGEANRFGLALYHHLASKIDLRNQDVLEIGCGRGGGAALIQSCFTPRSMTAMDFAEKAVALGHHQSATGQNATGQNATQNIRFTTGDAEQIPFAAAAFDAVISVESSHGYPNIEHFFQEVKRVLRDHGYFLLADFRPRTAVDLLRRQLQQSGLTLLQEEVITANVVAALDLDTERRLALCAQYVPAPLQNIFNNFAGVRGSQAYQEFQTAQTEYLCLVLKRDSTRQNP